MQKRAVVRAGALVLASLALSAFDERIARWSQQSSVQGGEGRKGFVRGATTVNEWPLTLAAAGAYGVGRLIGSPTTADVALHVGESLLVTEAGMELLRCTIGRRRPRASPGDPFSFRLGGGFTRFEDRSFPSLHAAVAFATATSLVDEIRLRNPSAARYAAPPLYAAALIPGFTRLYLDQHWASDVAVGAVLGSLAANVVVRRAHDRTEDVLSR